MLDKHLDAVMSCYSYCFMAIPSSWYDKHTCREWKLSAIDPHYRDTWRSGVRSAMRAASQLPGMGPLLWIWPLYLHVNQKSDDDGWWWWYCWKGHKITCHPSFLSEFQDYKLWYSSKSPSHNVYTSFREASDGWTEIKMAAAGFVLPDHRNICPDRIRAW